MHDNTASVCVQNSHVWLCTLHASVCLCLPTCLCVICKQQHVHAPSNCTIHSHPWQHTHTHHCPERCLWLRMETLLYVNFLIVINNSDIGLSFVFIFLPFTFCKAFKQSIKGTIIVFFTNKTVSVIDLLAEWALLYAALVWYKCLWWTGTLIAIVFLNKEVLLTAPVKQFMKDNRKKLQLLNILLICEHEIWYYIRDTLRNKEQCRLLFKPVGLEI